MHGDLSQLFTNTQIPACLSRYAVAATEMNNLTIVVITGRNDLNGQMFAT